MLVTRISILSGRTFTLDLPITPEQLQAVQTRTRPIQTIVSDLSPALREFLMTGITPQEWDETFKEEEKHE